MKTAQFIGKGSVPSADDLKPLKSLNPQLVMVFASVDHLTSPTLKNRLAETFSQSTVIGCTTAGEISGKGVTDKSVVVTAIQFDKIKIKAVRATCKNSDDSKRAGTEIAEKLKDNDLKASFILSPGTDVNGTSLVDGIQSVLGKSSIITGGLAGDGGNFKQTFTLHNGEVSDRQVIGLGFYGPAVQVGFGSMGGWKPFGPARVVTKSVNNVVYEIDGQPALQVYKTYLGAEAAKLPASGLKFPLAILNANEDQTGLIRTILGVNEADGSMTFAGDISKGSLVRLMHSDRESLVTGASDAANAAKQNVAQGEGFSLLVSCVGRKLVLGDDIDEEIEAVQKSVGKLNILTGFYSYGEICPFVGLSECKLHNQTMTITWLREAA